MIKNAFHRKEGRLRLLKGMNNKVLGWQLDFKHTKARVHCEDKINKLVFVSYKVSINVISCPTKFIGFLGGLQT